MSNDIQIVEIHRTWLFQVFQLFHYSMKPHSQALFLEKEKKTLWEGKAVDLHYIIIHMLSIGNTPFWGNYFLILDDHVCM